MLHGENALTIKYEKMRLVGNKIEYGVVVIIIIIKEIKFRKEEVKYLLYMYVR
jgi:hypothetical protein